MQYRQSFAKYRTGPGEKLSGNSSWRRYISAGFLRHNRSLPDTIVGENVLCRGMEERGKRTPEHLRDLPGDSVAKAPHSQCRPHWSQPGPPALGV